MKIIEPSFEILDCPDGKKCLSKLERICRLAYKSEDKIDDGKETCDECEGKRFVSYQKEVPCGFCISHEIDFKTCPTCNGKGFLQVREPSSHKLIRNILKTDRREKLYDKIDHYLQMGGVLDDPNASKLSDDILAKNIVDMVLDTVRDDPPHESVLEHENITVLFKPNRSWTHELVRHRVGVAYTQESTRYVNYSKGKFGSEITVTGRTEKELGESSKAFDTWMDSLEAVEQGYMTLLREGVKPEIARDLLPQVLKAEIICTANLRAWLHIFRMRCSPKAHPDMRSLMIPLRDEFKKRIPIIFDEV